MIVEASHSVVIGPEFEGLRSLVNSIALRIVIVVASCATCSVAQAASCESLATLALPHVKIRRAEITPAGGLTLPDAAEIAQELRKLPNFCRVAAESAPTPDSDIKFELWLPASGWNGKFLAVGNGGWAGSINYEDMIEPLSHGYATASTDDGHTGSSGSFALGHPEKLIDFAYRSEHEMTVAAKAIVAAFYGRTPQYSYWVGCSGGGREGLLEAHRYPEDFDGIVAGDPATFKRNAWAIWLATQTFADPARYIPPSKYPMVHKAVLEACDALDGLKDGLIEDPTRCTFDPKSLQCKADDGADCLTKPQVDAARALMGINISGFGAKRAPRLEPGAELGWRRVAGGPQPVPLFFDYFKYVVFKNPNWDWRNFNLTRDLPLADKVAEGVIDLNPDLREFARHGGKLLIYHGWADQQVAPQFIIDFYTAVLTNSPANSEQWLRLFMAPGMGHCGGGEGPNDFEPFSALEAWVEHGKAPDQIIASHRTNGKVDRTRPLCPYPRIAVYNGTASIDEAGNFTCKRQ